MGPNSAGGGGEIVQVQGGHIIRATGRKDRHSKVFTAKGPRDRRVRLSANTAIQFYDVQDRLGYDRPSKAVDWLIKKAKASIDKLAELPPRDPTANSASVATTVDDGNGNGNNNNNNNAGSTEIPVPDHTGSYHHHVYVPQQGNIDSMKSFFPTNNNNNNSEDNNHHHQMNFQNYPHELISRGSNINNISHQNQDLCLSLHTLQHPSSHSSHAHAQAQAQALFQGSVSLGYDGGGGWGDQQQHQDLTRFTRLMGWAGGGGGDTTSLSPQAALMLGQQQQHQGGYSQRGTLQSSYSTLIRAFEDNHSNNNHNHHNHHSSILGLGSDGFMQGFGFPSQIHHGDLHEGASMSHNRASSSSLSPDSSQH